MGTKSHSRKKETPEDALKIEIASELGLLEKVRKHGWGGLTAQETGRIGGIITGRKRMEKLKRDENKKPSN